jgi:basic amino acid/polyamine antiporter, APA family
VSFVITGIMPYDKLNVPDPIAVGVDAIGLTWLSPIIKLGAILGLTSVILVLLIGQPRIFYSMSREPQECWRGAGSRASIRVRF